MDQCKRCHHRQKAHLPHGCGCGCPLFQSPEQAQPFNSMAGWDEILKHAETLKLRPTAES